MVKKRGQPEQPTLSDTLFKEAVKGITPLTQDTYVPPRSPQVFAAKQKRRGASTAARQQGAVFEFSDLFEGHINTSGPLRYCQPQIPTSEMKRLRRGDYYPEYILDLHGLTKAQTKLELAALMDTAYKENVDCVCIVHGIGAGVLKHALPHYLIQHPRVLAFHQAPLEFGGQGAILALLRTPE
jgi:DNA-nicking Smr family endonuclease